MVKIRLRLVGHVDFVVKRVDHMKDSHITRLRKTIVETIKNDLQINELD